MSAESLARSVPPSPRPSFIGIGTGKAGTTWLWGMLRQHPEIFLPSEKELHYFDEEWYGPPGLRNERADRPLAWYLAHFEEAGPDQLCGEITPSYLWNPTAAKLLNQFDPDLKLFAILRDPTERVFSSFQFSLLKGEIEQMAFEQALTEHPYLVERTRYGQFLDRYLDHFPPDQLAIRFYDDLRSDPRAFLIDIESYLGVSSFVPDDVDERQNVTVAHAYPRLNRAMMRARMGLKRHGLERFKDRADRVGLTRPLKWLQGQVRPFDETPRMQPETEQELRQGFVPDIERIEALTGRDLAAWKPTARLSGDQFTGGIGKAERPA